MARQSILPQWNLLGDGHLSKLAQGQESQILMTESTFTPLAVFGDALTIADIQKIVDQAKRMPYPAIRPSKCKCGKHGVYWVWTSKKQKEEADEILFHDPVHMEFITHLKECGMNHSLDPLTLDDIVAIDSERKV